MHYLIFNTKLHAFIPTNITDNKEARKKVEQLELLFPNNDWDYSNAEWTLKYKELDVVMHKAKEANLI